jgi:hypothetical protein
MSFRDTFGSRLREVREQAKEVVQNMKLPHSIPTFDDMAARDDYIHSEEFNVRGQPREYKNSRTMKDRQQITRSYPEQRQDIIMDDNLDETTSSISSEVTKTATASPLWSLLDQPSIKSTGTIDYCNETCNNKAEEPIDPTFTMSNTTLSLLNESDRAVQAEAVTILKHGTLLSIVTDTLQDIPTISKESTTKLPSGSMTNLPTDRIDKQRNNNNDDDNDSLDEFDGENDPILSLMQLKQDHTTANFNETSLNIEITPTSYQSQPKKSVRRFMDDLERRLELPENAAAAGNLLPSTISVMELEAGRHQHHQQSLSAAPYVTRASHVGAVLDMAMRNIQRMVQKSDPSPVALRNTSSITPPLARVRTPKPSTTTRPEETFSITASDSVLSQSEFDALTRKTSSINQVSIESLVTTTTTLYEHRNYLFIAFTLLLAVYVYFLTQKRLGDVT